MIRMERHLTNKDWRRLCGNNLWRHEGRKVGQVVLGQHADLHGVLVQRLDDNVDIVKLAGKSPFVVFFLFLH